MFGKKKDNPNPNPNTNSNPKNTENIKNIEKNPKPQKGVEAVTIDHKSQLLIQQHVHLHKENQSLKKQIQLLLLILILSISIVGALFWAFSQYPKYRYIVTTDNQKICEVPTIGKNTISPAALENFAQEALLDVYRYDYVNFESQTQQALNRFFTFNGRAAYYDSLSQSGNFEKIKANKLISKASLVRSAQIEKEQVRFGRYEWQIAMPIKIEFYKGSSDVSQDQVASQSFLAIMTVVQETASKVNPKGVAVDALVLKPM